MEYLEISEYYYRKIQSQLKYLIKLKQCHELFNY